MDEIYEVTIREVLERKVKIVASSRELAEIEAEKLYLEQKVVLDWSDFSYVEYEAVESEDDDNE